MKRLHLLFVVFAHMAILNTVIAQNILKQDNKYGLCDENGNVIVKPVYDSVYHGYDKDTWEHYYILKQNDHYGYAIKHDKNDSVYWSISETEFDSLYPAVMSYRNTTSSPTQAYLVIVYSKNGLKGLITVEYTLSSEGIMFMEYFYTAIGRLKIYKEKYNHIYCDFDASRNEWRGGGDEIFFVTCLNDKYGFLELSHNFETAPEFDTIPVFENSQKRYVRKNGKWGLVHLNALAKTIEYEVPCICNAIGRGKQPGLYFCAGQDDTLKIYNALTGHTFVPLFEQKPIICSFNWRSYDNRKYTLGDYIGSNMTIMDKDSSYYSWEIIDSVNGIITVSQRFTYLEDNDSLRNMCYTSSYKADKKVYAYNMTTNSVIYSFTDTTAFYAIYEQKLVIKAMYDASKKMYVREFYDAQTGALKFILETADQYFHIVDSQYDSDYADSKDGIENSCYLFYSRSDAEQKRKKFIGVYNPETGVFSKRKKG